MIYIMHNFILAQYHICLLLTKSIMQNSHSHNPYEAIYKNLNLQINQYSTKEDAEKIAYQLVLLQNTLDIMTQDLIKLSSFKCQQNSLSGTKKLQNIQVQDQNSRESKSQQKVLAIDGYKINIQNYSTQGQQIPKTIDSPNIFMKKKKEMVPIVIDDSQEELIREEEITNKSPIRPLTRRSTFVDYRYQNLRCQQTKNKCKRKQNKVTDQMSISLEVPLNQNKQQQENHLQYQSQNRRSHTFERYKKQKKILLFDNQDSISKNKYPKDKEIFQNKLSENLLQGEKLNKLYFAQAIYPLSLNSNKQDSDDTFQQSEQKSESFEMINKLFSLIRKNILPQVNEIIDSD